MQLYFGIMPLITLGITILLDTVTAYRDSLSATQHFYSDSRYKMYEPLLPIDS